MTKRKDLTYFQHNLHVHTSTFSDGKHDIKSMIDIASEQDINMLAITDHAFSHKFKPQYMESHQIITFDKFNSPRIVRLDNYEVIQPNDFVKVFLPDVYEKLLKKHDDVKSEDFFAEHEVFMLNVKRQLFINGAKGFVGPQGVKYVTVRNDYRKLDEYVDTIEQNQMYAANKEIVLLKGIEFTNCDSGYPLDYIRDNLDFILVEELCPANGRSLMDTSLLDSLGDIHQVVNIPVGLAHFDLNSFEYTSDFNDVAKALAANDIFIELSDSEPYQEGGYGRNTYRNGTQYYENFSQEMIEALLKNDVAFVCGTDSHNGSKIRPDNAYDFSLKHSLRMHDMVIASYDE